MLYYDDHQCDPHAIFNKHHPQLNSPTSSNNYNGLLRQNQLKSLPCPMSRNKKLHKKEFICKDQQTRELGLLCQFPSACFSLKKGARRSPRAQQQKLPPQLRRQLPHTAAETCLLPAARKLSHATSAEQRVQYSQTNEVHAGYKTSTNMLRLEKQSS